MISITRLSNTAFDEAINLNGMGSNPTGSTSFFFNEKISLVKTGFDETILIAKGTMAQVNDPIKDSRGRSSGIVVSGATVTF